MAIILTCLDYLGRVVQLDDGQWQGHIVDRHRELQRLLDQVQATTEVPTLVTLDLADAQRECFYRRGVLPQRTRLYLKVCVDFGPDRTTATTGFIVTAFLTSRVPRQEMLLWQT